MDATEYIHGSLTRQAYTCDVLRDKDATTYGASGPSKVGTAAVAIFAPTTASETVVEGSGEDTSFTGMVVPEYDSNGNLTETIKVNDVLVPQTASEQRYDVRVKDGVPDQIDPDLWRLGLERANASE